VRRWPATLAAAALLAATLPATASADGIAVTIDGSPAATSDSTPTFTFGSDDPAALFSCRIDAAGGVPVDAADPCTSPHTPAQPLPDGAYVFTVAAIDPVAGTTGEATRGFTVAPDTSISGPSGPTNDASPALGLTASDPDATIECKLNGPGHGSDDFAACDATVAYTDLADGDYTFAARATDAAGNTGAVATRSFTVDTMPPAAPALSGTPAAFAFSGEPGASFRCRLDGPAGPGAEAACTSPRAYPGLNPGAYTFSVRAIDAAGNAGPAAALPFTVPAPALAAPPPSAPTPLLPPAPPTPRRHATVVVRPGLADVRVRVPGSAAFVPLTADRALPLGTLVDTRRGSVQLIAAPKRQRATFHGAVFRVTQPGNQTVLTLIPSGCHAAKLTGEGRGAFAVRGRYSTTSVRSARWLVRDSCAGTLTRVLDGVVVVRDTVRRRTLLLRAGRGYLARPNT
jgi:hypothetical protein